MTWQDLDAAGSVVLTLTHHGSFFQDVMECIEAAASRGALSVEVDYDRAPKTDDYSRDQVWAVMKSALDKKGFSVSYERSLRSYTISWDPWGVR